MEGRGLDAQRMEPVGGRERYREKGWKDEGCKGGGMKRWIDGDRKGWRRGDMMWRSLHPESCKAV